MARLAGPLPCLCWLRAALRPCFAAFRKTIPTPSSTDNGPTGRLLIVVMLIDAEVLQLPLSIFSLFFQAAPQPLLDLLNGVRQNGDWEALDRFLPEGVEEHGDTAVDNGPASCLRYFCSRRSPFEAGWGDPAQRSPGLLRPSAAGH